MEWFQLLSASLEAEFGGKPRIGTLATVDEQGNPRARSVVCRRLLEEGSVCFASDSRSEKNGQLRRRGAAELVFWLPTLRQQFRLRGGIKIFGAKSADPLRAELWSALTDASRALFFWPEPGGVRRLEDKFFRVVLAPTSAPTMFEVLVMRPVVVHHLDLSPHPHRMRRWCRREHAPHEWDVEELNP